MTNNNNNNNNKKKPNKLILNTLIGFTIGIVIAGMLLHSYEPEIMNYIQNKLNNINNNNNNNNNNIDNNKIKNNDKINQLNKEKIIPHSDIETSGPINTLIWDDDPDFLAKILNKRIPVIIKNGPGSNWSKNELFDFNKLKTKIPLLENVRRKLNDQDSTYILKSKKNLPFIGRNEIDEIEIIPAMTFQYFLDTANDPEQYLYYTTPLEDWAKLGINITDWSKLEYREALLDQLNFTTNDIIPALWMNHPGVVAHCHHDRSNNFFIQLKGKKRFLLFPPKAHRRLYPYPSIHVSYEQSQVNFDDPDLDLFPLFGKVRPYEAYVEEGDMLYLPPFWYHRVETKELSLSFSILNPSSEEIVLADAYWTKVPFNNMKTREEKIVAAQVYLTYFISRFEDWKSPRRFARNLYKTRFRSLYPEDGIELIQNEKHFSCVKNTNATLYNEIIRTKLPQDPIKNTARFVAMRIAHPAISKSIRDIWAENYVEELARWAVGPHDVVYFIRNCLNFDAIEIIDWEKGPEKIVFEELEETEI